MSPRLTIRHLSCASVLLGVALFALPASAGGSRSGGALGRTTGAVQGATSHPGRNPGGSSSSPSSDHHHGRAHYYDYDYGRPYCPTCTYVAPGAPPGAHPGNRAGRTHLALELGLQAVEDSDGAMMGDVRIGRGDLALGLAGTRYIENTQALDGSNSIYMNVWAITLGYRGFDDGDTQVWLSGGLAGSDSNNFEASLRGVTVGAALENRLGRTLRLMGTVRYFLLGEGMRGSEVKAALAASYLSLGYRVFRFNVGEPLHGPEFGVSLRF